MMIYIEPCAGLGNRILALATAYDIVKQTEQQMTVLWDVDGAVGIDLDRLFQLPNDIKIIHTTKLPYRNSFYLRCKSEIIRGAMSLIVKESLDCGDVERIIKQEGYEKIFCKFRQHNKLYVKSFCELEKIEDKEIFKIFKPTKEIEGYGKIIFNQINEKMIGVHIRRTDHIDAIKNSPTFLFIEKMRDMLKEKKANRFFLATDDVQVEREMIDIFGDKILLNKDKRLSRSDEKGMMDAFIDMLALSKCSYIIGSYGSTFNKVASYLGDVELIIMER